LGLAGQVDCEENFSQSVLIETEFCVKSNPEMASWAVFKSFIRCSRAKAPID